MRFMDLFRPFYYLVINIITILINLFIWRDKSIMLMGAWYGCRFADNSRYLFQYLHENKEKYGLKKVIWVTREEEIYDSLKDLGYEVYMMKSFRGFFYHFRAGIHALSVNLSSSSATGKKVGGDLMGELSMGAKRLYLTHGVAAIKGSKFLENNQSANLSFKDKVLIKTYKFAYSITMLRHFMLVPGGWDKVLFLASTQATADRDQARSVKIKDRRYVIAGFPELCEPLKYLPKEKEILEHLDKHSKKVLYIPTYRTSEKTGYEHPLDNQAFCSFLRENNIYWIDKLHPGAGDAMKATDYPDDIAMLLESDFDMNIIMRQVDVVISDYSAAVQNAIYYHKPIVNYWGDLEGYIQNGSGIVKSFFDDAVGEKAYSVDELKNAINNAFSTEYFDNYEDVYRDKFLYFFGGRTSDYEETAETIFGLL